MSKVIPFLYEENQVQTATATYLPFATRTLAIQVKNGTDTATKLWLRPVNVPDSFQDAAVHGYGGQAGQPEHDLLVHWGGGDKTGACVKMREINPIKDKDIQFWKVTAVELDPGEERRVYLNITHQSGEVRPYDLALGVVTKDADDNEVVLNGRLDLTLNPPETADGPVTDPVRGVWQPDGNLTFQGAQLMSYVARWHTSNDFIVHSAGDILNRLHINSDGRWIRVKLDDKQLMEIEDIEWGSRDGRLRDLTSISPCLPELYHLCGGRYYALRIWFLWVNRLIGDKHEVPDAERFDIFFDLEEKEVVYLGTDFHYKELWGELNKPERGAQAKLGLAWNSIGQFKDTWLAVEKKRDVFKAKNPSALLINELCTGVEVTPKTVRGGTAAHVPLLRNVFFQFKSEDVREL